MRALDPSFAKGLLVSALALAAGLLLAGTARALIDPAPPERTTIEVGKSMDGARLAQRARVVTDTETDTQYVDGPRIRKWGAVDEFCFEGSTCSWAIEGGDHVTLEVEGGRERLVQIHTTAPRWKTSWGVGPGSTALKVRNRYGKAKYRTVCWGPYGAEGRGYVLNRRKSKTLFETGRRNSDVDAVRILRSRTVYAC